MFSVIRMGQERTVARDRDGPSPGESAQWSAGAGAVDSGPGFIDTEEPVDVPTEPMVYDLLAMMQTCTDQMNSVPKAWSRAA
jgi:hypothetical protein